MPKVTKTANTEMIDYRAEVLAQMNANVSRASMAVGTEAVGMIVKQMRDGYGKPIRQTGDLMRDVNSEVHEDGGGTTITVGNSLDYALYVHEGTSRMAGRHYITDAIMAGWDRLQKVWASYLKEGFK